MLNAGEDGGRPGRPNRAFMSGAKPPYITERKSAALLVRQGSALPQAQGRALRYERCNIAHVDLVS